MQSQYFQHPFICVIRLYFIVYIEVPTFCENRPHTVPHNQPEHGAGCHVRGYVDYVSRRSTDIYTLYINVNLSSKEGNKKNKMINNMTPIRVLLLLQFFYRFDTCINKQPSSSHVIIRWYACWILLALVNRTSVGKKNRNVSLAIQLFVHTILHFQKVAHIPCQISKI